MRGLNIEALRTIPIRTVAEDLGFQLTAKGTGRCRLPEHRDRNPSFSLHDLNNRFTCYGCGRKGSVIDLVMGMLTMDFRQACGWLAERYSKDVARSDGASLPRASWGRWLTVRSPIAVNPSPPMSKEAPDGEVFGWLLQSSALAPSGTAYLKTRGFTEAAIKHFRIGQILDRAQSLNDALVRFGRQRLEDCGLIDPGPAGDRLVFPTGYLLFPFLAGDEVSYLQARRSDQGNSWRWMCPKGLLPPVFNRNVLLSDASTISICEGVTDVISAHELGLQAIGLVGAHGHLDAHTLANLRGRNVDVYGDADEAGLRFSRRLVSTLSGVGISAIAKQLPGGANDLNDHLRRMDGQH